MIKRTFLLLFIILISLGGFFWYSDFSKPKEESSVVLPLEPSVEPIEDVTPVVEEPVVVQPEEPVVQEKVIPLEVPFLVQAPFGEWADPIFENACEEASIIMARHWIEGTGVTPEQGKKEILALVEYQKKKFGHSIDTSSKDTKQMLKDVYGVPSEVLYDLTLQDMKNIVQEGSIFIVPADGRKLGNPHFTQPGPPVHMLLVIGYDTKTKEFIVNDPGTRHGKMYRYAENVLYSAIGDYPTGKHVNVDTKQKAAIVVSKIK
ncbi:MAG: C39 family peptidase [Patescibacteria group bacterium]